MHQLRSLAVFFVLAAACNGAADRNVAPPTTTSLASRSDTTAVATSTAASTTAVSPSATPSAAVVGPTASTTAPPVEQRGKPRGAIGSSAAAVQAFRAAWTEEVIPGATSGHRKSFVDSWTDRVAKGKLEANRVECREGHHRVDTTLGGTERTDLVLFSSIEAFNREGQCWEIAVSHAFNAVIGYLDAKTGALVFVWLVPEG